MRIKIVEKKTGRHIETFNVTNQELTSVQNWDLGNVFLTTSSEAQKKQAWESAIEAGFIPENGKQSDYDFIVTK